MSNRRKLPKREKPSFAFSGMIEKVDVPDEQKELLKQVPAKVDGTVVGVANLYDDGSVDVIMDEDAPQWAVDKIKATEKEFAYYLASKQN